MEKHEKRNKIMKRTCDQMPLCVTIMTAIGLAELFY